MQESHYCRLDRPRYKPLALDGMEHGCCFAPLSVSPVAKPSHQPLYSFTAQVVRGEFFGAVGKRGIERDLLAGDERDRLTGRDGRGLNAADFKMTGRVAVGELRAAGEVDDVRIRAARWSGLSVAIETIEEEPVADLDARRGNHRLLANGQQISGAPRAGARRVPAQPLGFEMAGLDAAAHSSVADVGHRADTDEVF